MNKKFMIHYHPGTGGFFLTTVFAKLMNIAINTAISDTGDCHDLGQGIWNEVDGINFAHSFDKSIGDLKLMYHPGVNLYSTHAVTPEFIQKNPDIKVIQIGAMPEDYRLITTMFVKKAWPNLWTEEEYNKWVSPYYPPYSRNNIAESELICQDLINDFIITRTPIWFEQHSQLNYAHVINFKTVMGLNDENLVNIVAKITGGKITDDIHDFVREYQQLNKKLYFNHARQS